MKRIVAVPIWYNGQSLNAEWLYVNVNNIQLGVNASFNYILLSNRVNPIHDKDEPDVTLQTGICNMTDEEYSNWGNNDDYVWTFVATKLNLTII